MHWLICGSFVVALVIVLYLLMKCKKNEKFSDDYETLDDNNKENYARSMLHDCYDQCPDEAYCIGFCTQANDKENCMEMCRHKSQCITGCLYNKCNGNQDCVAQMQ